MSGAMPIYLDHHATTPADPRVIEAMLPWFGHRFGNPHSVDHEWGWQAEEAVEQARRQVANLVGATPSEVIFTSGATEANNLALLGLAPALRSLAATRKAGPPHIVASPFEHSCVTACLAALQQEGFAVTLLPAGFDGVVEPRALEQALTPATVLVTVTAASHEIGTVQPVAALAGLSWEAGAVLHSDAAQAAGKIPFDIGAVNLATLSAHKIYGPKGIGALVRSEERRVGKEC